MPMCRLQSGKGRENGDGELMPTESTVKVPEIRSLENMKMLFQHIVLGWLCGEIESMVIITNGKTQSICEYASEELSSPNMMKQSVEMLEAHITAVMGGQSHASYRVLEKLHEVVTESMNAIPKGHA
jgi:hypothetical protein